MKNFKYILYCNSGGCISCGCYSSSIPEIINYLKYLLIPGSYKRALLIIDNLILIECTT